jgi:hypothetical protein
VAAGDALLTPSVTRRLIAEFARRPRSAPSGSGAVAHLTDREREVLEPATALSWSSSLTRRESPFRDSTIAGCRSRIRQVIVGAA